MFGFYYLDYTMLIILPALIFTVCAQIAVKSTYGKYSKINSRRGMTGYAAARKILDANGLFSITVEEIQGNLTDHYDPKAKVIRLSSNVYRSASVAAIGVAAHEAGHAVQHAEDYAPIKLRSAIIPITSFASNAAFPLFFIGILIEPFWYLMWAGIVLYGFAVIFQLVTLPVEFNASRRALSSLSGMGILDEAEISGSKKVLSAAAMTYVAALSVSLLSLLRLILIANGRRR